ncbi:alpha,alpha-trehalase TreF [Pontibacter sp. SGAir0037]|uniref:alpha,alpha-trehalase TreF n=1 Tax=Pontibacter sp. SGAir0037 TaxID=2571030 RepID=UPI0010CD50B6|nr:alpha,alpha-trehalase TreF [Pontibacter sp. SGAir0037]QCR24784.1 trehalase [Pontibacter sp. SGAir0037]
MKNIQSIVPSRINKGILLLLRFCLLWVINPVAAQFKPEEQLGELFKQVQLKEVFSDSKTFVDCIPKSSPEAILSSYQEQKDNASFNLRDFVLQHFELPPEPATNFKSDTSLTVSEHIRQLWPILTREPGTDNSSLLPLPYPYVVPGGRFREIYYWDSYFTMLGLQASGETELIQYMVDNFSHLIETVGHIPNGNRSYYTSRSQPPFYSLMLKILAEEKGEQILLTYAPYLRQEYTFWMEGSNTLTSKSTQHRRVVKLPDGSILNRYWDDNPSPRPESYREDVQLAAASGRNHEEIYRNIKAAAESGWDFSSRWFTDGKTLATIHTTDIIPVDLNALLYHLEKTLAEVASLQGNKAEEQFFTKKAKSRQKALLKYCWSKADGFFYDYDFVKTAHTAQPTLAGVFPLYFRIAKPKQAARIAKRIEADFLKPGGLVTSLNRTGEQWDSPNGWAPLQWISYKGLTNYGYNSLADTIAANWIRLNKVVYHHTGKMVEKYNVEDLTLEAGGGEYPNQDGFGWTNGVLLKLLFLEAEASAPATEKILHKQ